MESQFIAISKIGPSPSPRATPGELGLRTAQPWRLKPELGQDGNITPFRCYNLQRCAGGHISSTKGWKPPENLQLMSHESWVMGSHLRHHLEALNKNIWNSPNISEKITQSMAVSSMAVRWLKLSSQRKILVCPEIPSSPATTGPMSRGQTTAPQMARDDLSINI